MNKRQILLGVYRYGIALIIGTLVGSLFIAAKGEDPIFAYKVLVEGAFVGRAAVAQTLRWATPAILSGLAVTLAFRAGVSNMGVEGQLYVGALVSAMVGYSISLPPVIHTVFALLCGGLAGAAWELVPAYLKMKFGINEIVNTLMLNYVASLFTEYLVRVFIMGSSAAAVPSQVVTPQIAVTATLPKLMPPYQANIGLVLGIFMAVALYTFFRRTVKGYELDLAGRNPSFVQYGGVDVKKLTFSAFLASGFIGGLVGAVEILGVHYKFAAQFSSNLGFDGLLIALLARLNPLAVIPVGFLWGALRNGAYTMERMTSVSRMVIQVVQALFVLFITVDSGTISVVLEKVFRVRRTGLGTEEMKGGIQG